VRGPLAAAWAGAGTFLYLEIRDAATGPLTLYVPRAAAGARIAAAGDPLTAAARLFGVLLSPPCLLQVAVWAGLAAAMGYAFSRRRLEARLWVWSFTFVGVFAAYRIVPIAVWHYPASLGVLLPSVVLAASVILLPLILTTGEAPEERDDGDLQEG
jgi:hypothetical protein